MSASLRGSYRPQGRWAERAERVPIKTLPEMDLSDFTPIKLHLESDNEHKPDRPEQLLSKVSCGTRSCTLHQASPDSGFNRSWF